MAEKQAYNPKDIETKWYDYWTENKLFRSVPDEREPYTIVIPPPNVTGVLHMGHMLNNTIQDVLIRRARMQGYNACWVPGSDHASIATESKVVAKLREEGISKYDIGREEFLKHAWEWTDKYGGIIYSQLKRLGASCDWDRTRFTLEDKLSKAVIKTFVELFNKGYIYRDWKIINWDPKAQTTLSNEEVIRKDVNSHLYYVKYKVKETNQFLTIATTRPETIMGDTAVCVHPDDERYKNIIGKTVIVPLVNREVKIIADTYIDMEFGTGVLKVTPAHDTNDYDIGVKHNLEIIDTLNPDGTLSEAAQILVGEDRFVARKKVAKMLEEQGLLEKTEQIQNSVGYSERNSDTVVEPRLSLQWFVNMEDIVKPALENVMNDNIEFFPTHFKNVYKHWLENIRDWPISRQLWWGHRIPAFYYGEGNNDFVVAETAEAALALAKEKTGNSNLSAADLKQDEDALDTWFSSWLWPISVFDGFEDDKTEVNYYYPTNVLVTGWDIIFFWVARMVFAGYEFKGEMPFKHVYFTGMVRDPQGRKMSKSLGNSPDTMKLIDDFGADGVRFGVLSCAAAGNDLLFDEKLCLNGRNFSNKIWNANNLIMGWAVTEGKNQDNLPAIEWFENKLNETILATEKSYESYRLSEALMTVYNLIWSEFCSSYLEFIKPEYGQAIDNYTLEKTKQFFDKLLRLLHPFMPFLTEELWQQLGLNNGVNSICIAKYPKAENVNQTAINKGEYAKDIISKIRELRNRNNLKNKDEIACFVMGDNADIYADFKGKIQRACNINRFEETNKEVDNTESFIVKGQQFFIDLGLEIDAEAQKAEWLQELEYAKGFVKSVEKKLSNERFVNNAPEAVVAKEKAKLADGLAKIKLLEESLAKL